MDVQEVFEALPGTRPSMMHERGRLDPDNAYRDTILYERNGLFTYFFFDGYGQLAGVGQATFNMDGADCCPTRWHQPGAGLAARHGGRLLDYNAYLPSIAYERFTT